MNILSEKIIAANTLGKTNLIEKGVTLFEDATTYEIMQGIADVPSSGGGSSGIEYTSIAYNDDDTITLIDTNGNEHTIVCEYDGDKLVSATYDDKTIELTYEDENLVGVGGTVVDLTSAHLTIPQIAEHKTITTAEMPVFDAWSTFTVKESE